METDLLLYHNFLSRYAQANLQKIHKYVARYLPSIVLTGKSSPISGASIWMATASKSTHQANVPVHFCLGTVLIGPHLCTLVSRMTKLYVHGISPSNHPATLGFKGVLPGENHNCKG